MVEYGLVVAAIAIVALVGAQAVGTNLLAKFHEHRNQAWSEQPTRGEVPPPPEPDLVSSSDEPPTPLR